VRLRGYTILRTAVEESTVGGIAVARDRYTNPSDAQLAETIADTIMLHLCEYVFVFEDESGEPLPPPCRRMPH